MTNEIQKLKYGLVFSLLFLLRERNKGLCERNGHTERFDSRWGELCPNECVLRKQQQDVTTKLSTEACDLYRHLSMTWILYEEKLRLFEVRKIEIDRDAQLVNGALLKVNKTIERNAVYLRDIQRIFDKSQIIMNQITSQNEQINEALLRVVNNKFRYKSQDCEPVSQEEISCKLPIIIARDCAELYLKGARKNGVYFIIPDSMTTPMKAYCDMEDAGGGWTVIQRRFSGCLNFMRSWGDYRNGFGQWSCNDVGELWMGNENIYKLTQQDKQQLKVDLVSCRNEERYAWFSYFRIGNETERYKLRFIEGYRRDPNTDIGNAFRGFTFGRSNYDDQKKMEFSINCDTVTNCTNNTSGGWWFNKRNLANLNANWYQGKLKLEMMRKGLSENEIMWKTWQNRYFKKTTMKIRPLGFNSNADHGIKHRITTG